tara:strand:+ start:417 stop:599 length:183 start_codon:yes stop_codon:yes gene_type:complete
MRGTIVKVGDLVKYKREDVIGVITHVFLSENLQGMVEVQWADGYRSDTSILCVEVIDENR